MKGRYLIVVAVLLLSLSLLALPADHDESSATTPLTPGDPVRGVIDAELAVLPRLQRADGGFDISWQWNTPYPEAFQQARTWWRARLTIDKLLFQRQFTRE